MNAQDLKIEKLNLITWIAQLQDSTLIEKLKNFRAKNDNSIEVSDWEKQTVRDRIKNTKAEDYVSWEDIERQIKFD